MEEKFLRTEDFSPWEIHIHSVHVRFWCYIQKVQNIFTGLWRLWSYSVQKNHWCFTDSYFSPSPAGIYSVWREWRKVPDLLKLTVITEKIFMPMEFNILFPVYFPRKFILRKEFTLKLLQYFTSLVYQYISTVECKKWIFELKLFLSPGDKWCWICPQSCLLSLYAEYSSS